MSKYFFISGIVLVLLAVLNLVLFGQTGVDIIFIVNILLAFMFLIYPKIKDKLSKFLKIVLSTVMMIISIITNLIFLFFIVMIIFNLPKTKHFDGEIIFDKNPCSQEEAYEQFINLISKNNDSLDLNLSEDRDKIFNFITENIISIPLEKCEDGYKLPLDYIVPDYINLKKSYKKELENITDLIDRGDTIEAQKKYIILWEITENLFSGRNTLIHNMVSIVSTNILTDYYMVNADKLHLKNNIELINILQNVIPVIDKSMREAYIIESGYFIDWLKEENYQNIQYNNDNDVLYIFINIPLNIIGKRLDKWPFFDRYEFLKVYEETFKIFIKSTGKPIYEIEENLDRVNQIYNNFASSIRFKNLTGKYFLELMMGLRKNFYNLMYRKEACKSKVIAMEYLLSFSDSIDIEKIPTDNLTEEKFNVTYENGILSIIGEEVDYTVELTDTVSN